MVICTIQISQYNLSTATLYEVFSTAIGQKEGSNICTELTIFTEKDLYLMVLKNSRGRVGSANIANIRIFKRFKSSLRRWTGICEFWTKYFYNSTFQASLYSL